MGEQRRNPKERNQAKPGELQMSFHKIHDHRISWRVARVPQSRVGRLLCKVALTSSISKRVPGGAQPGTGSAGQSGRFAVILLAASEAPRPVRQARTSLRCFRPRPLAERGAALVRLRRREDGAVEVRSCAVKNRAASNRNCVAARRGGEQRNENDQSVTQAARVDRRRELDSVGVDGRACERVAKPVKRAIGGEPNRRTAG